MIISSEDHVLHHRPQLLSYTLELNPIFIEKTALDVQVAIPKIKLVEEHILSKGLIGELIIDLRVKGSIGTISYKVTVPRYRVD